MAKDIVDKGQRLAEGGQNAAVTITAVGDVQKQLAAKDAAHRAATAQAPAPIPATELNVATGVGETATVTGTGEATAIADVGEKVVIEGAEKGGVGLLTRLGGVWGTVKTIAGKVVTPLMALIGVFQTAKAIKKKDGHAAAKIAGNTAGSIATMGVGTALGAVAADTAIGALGGPVGGVMGFMVGAVGVVVSLVVGVGTMIFGGWLGGKVVDTTVGNTLHKSLNEGTLPTTNKAAPVIQNIAAAEPVNEAPSFEHRARILAERQNRRPLQSSPQH